MGDRKRQKTYYNQKNRNKLYLEAGLRGFFCTCNFRERDLVKEAYNLLNEYADRLYGHSQNTSNTEANAEATEKDSEDISDQLAEELKELKEDRKKNVKDRRFQAVDTGASNCVFIRTNLPHPEEVTNEIFEEVLNSKSQKTRFLLRLLPVMITCKANLVDIIKNADELFDKYFLKEASTFAIIVNRRYNNSLPRDDVIKELAELITAKNINNKADLKKPQLAVILEVIKGICLISIVPNYFEYRKYNLSEVAKNDNDTEGGDENKEQNEAEMKGLQVSKTEDDTNECIDVDIKELNESKMDELEVSKNGENTDKCINNDIKELNEAKNEELDVSKIGNDTDKHIGDGMKEQTEAEIKEVSKNDGGTEKSIDVIIKEHIEPENKEFQVSKIKDDTDKCTGDNIEEQTDGENAGKLPNLSEITPSG